MKGGGAKSLDFQSLSQDLIRTSMQIPFSVPPYMSLLARSTATLEGIALMGDPNYQMVSQVSTPLTCSEAIVTQVISPVGWPKLAKSFFFLFIAS